MSERSVSSSDLSIEADLSIAVMHLISLEEHLCFSIQKTQKRYTKNC